MYNFSSQFRTKFRPLHLSNLQNKPLWETTTFDNTQLLHSNFGRHKERIVKIKRLSPIRKSPYQKMWWCSSAFTRKLKFCFVDQWDVAFFWFDDQYQKVEMIPLDKLFISFLRIKIFSPFDPECALCNMPKCSSFPLQFIYEDNFGYWVLFFDEKYLVLLLVRNSWLSANSGRFGYSCHLETRKLLEMTKKPCGRVVVEQV